MKVLTTFHSPSSVSHSLKCRLISDLNIEHLVVTKVNRIDIYTLQATGLRHECDLEVWGKVLSIKAIPVPASGYSNILVMLDHPDPELMIMAYSVSCDTPSLTTIKRVPLYERSARQAEYFNDVAVDPGGKLAVVSCYTGKLKLIILKDGNYESDFDVSISELTILALTFVLSAQSTQVLAILHFDRQERMQLISRDICLEALELSQSPSMILPNTVISAKTLPLGDTLPILIPIPPSSDNLLSPGGVLLIGGRKILFFELAPADWQEKHTGKERRLGIRMKSLDTSEVHQAKQKQLERQSKKRRPSATVEWPWSEVTAWCSIDSTDSIESRYLLGDSFGRLALLSLDVSAGRELTLLPLGESSPATTLTYLTTQILYLGSHMGDSHLLRINSTPVSDLDSPTLVIPTDITTTPISLCSSAAKGKGKADSRVTQGQGYIVDGQGKYVSVLETYKNIAPISDAVLVDIDGGGQRQVVTCSGGQNTGSINVIRNGADFEELAVITGIKNVTNIWPIRATFEDKLDIGIVVSTLEDTRLLRFDDRNSLSCVRPVSIGFIENQPTLALANVSRRIQRQATSYYENSSLMIQVTPKRAVLLDFQISLGEYIQVGQGWTPERMADNPLWDHLNWKGREVVAASINPSQVALALSGSILVLLNLSANDEFNVVSYRDLSSSGWEISAVSCAPPDSARRFSTYIVVSYWQSNLIELISIERSEPRLRSLCKTRSLLSLPCSILLHNFSTEQLAGPDNCPYLLAGLSDGTVATFAFRNKKFQEEKITSLGDSPVSLTACEVEGRRTVFACGSRVSIFCWEKKRLHQSSLLLKDVITASCLNTGIFSSCLILATSASLFIGKAKDLNQIHIRHFPLGFDNPRRIVHDPLLNVFGVCCVRPEPIRVGDPEFSRSSFRLLDGTSFSHMSQFNCEPDEETTAVENLSIDDSPPLFCVGTFYYHVSEHEPTDGRLLIFSLKGQPSGRSSQLSLIASAHVQGCIYALAIINGLIAVAVNASVVLFRVENKDQSVTLQKVTEWTHNYVVRNLVSNGEHLILGDAINSISILRLAGAQLQTVARDYGPLWPVCLQGLDARSIIAASGDLNLFTFALRHSETQMVLEREGSYHLAEMVTKFLPGTLGSPDLSCDFSLEAKQLFFTSSGRIGLILDIGDDLSLHMTALQRNLASMVAAGHTKYRASKNPRGHSSSESSSVGFIDGDLLEQFLGYDQETVERIYGGVCEIERLVMPLPQIQKFLEILRIIH